MHHSGQKKYFSKKIQRIPWQFAIFFTNFLRIIHIFFTRNKYSYFYILAKILLPFLPCFLWTYIFILKKTQWGTKILEARRKKMTSLDVRRQGYTCLFYKKKTSDTVKKFLFFRTTIFSQVKLIISSL